jgi:YD repeat-containing protein
MQDWAKGSLAFSSVHLLIETMKRKILLKRAACCAILLIGWVAGAGSSSVSYTYNAAGRLVGADYGAGQTISYAYDQAGNLLQASSPSPGLVPGIADTQHITLSWPAFPDGFILETTTQLGPGVQWQAVNAPAVVTGDQKVVTLAFVPNSFYRLRKP